MEIKDLTAGQGKIDLLVEVVSKDEVREFEKFGKTGRVCNAKVKDNSGEVKLTLWNDDIDKVNVGDKVQVTNGYVGEWKDELQLSAGKFGTLEVVSANKECGEDPECSMTSDEKVESQIMGGQENSSDSGEHILSQDENMTSEDSPKLVDSNKDPSLSDSTTGDEELDITEEDVV